MVLVSGLGNRNRATWCIKTGMEVTHSPMIKHRSRQLVGTSLVLRDVYVDQVQLFTNGVTTFRLFSPTSSFLLVVGFLGVFLAK